MRSTILDGDEFGGAAAALGDIDGAGPSSQAVVFGAVGDAGGGFRRGAVWVLFLEGTTLTDVSGPSRGTSLNALGPARPNPNGRSVTAAKRAVLVD